MGVMYLDFVHSSTVTSDIFSMAWSVTAKFRLEQFCFRFFYYLIGIGLHRIRGIETLVNKERWRTFTTTDPFEIDKVSQIMENGDEECYCNA